MAEIDKFFHLMKKVDASDLHLAAGSKPIVRVHGELQRVKYDVLSDDDLTRMLMEIIPDDKKEEFKETKDVDFAYEIKGLARFRANYLYQQWGIGAVFRLIPSEILTAEQLGLPEVVRDFALLERGLVLVTGPTGSGKSTTLAAIIDHANKTRKSHILTVEDPLEFIHQSQKSHVTHRQVGKHTQSFAKALRGALREDPDIILVGEMRDLETISLAVEAAATGHLVFGTLHTINAMKTVDRIIEVFPPSEQNQIRSTLADGVKGVVAQNLFKRIDKKGRCAALEVLVGTPAVANLIREGKTHQILSSMQTGKKFGMQTLDDDIERLLEKKMISPEEAFEKSIDKKRFIKHLKKVPKEFQSNGDLE